MAHTKGKTQKDIIESYDSDTDTMYVSFGTGEPSYVEEINDILALEIGIYSNLPTGFRIINFSKHKVGGVEIRVVVKRVKDKIKQERQEVFQNFQDRTTQLQESVHAAFASA